MNNQELADAIKNQTPDSPKIEDKQRQSDELLKRASGEIKMLRAHNEHMSARLKMFDDVMKLLNAQPEHNRQGYSEDIAWAIDKHLEPKI